MKLSISIFLIFLFSIALFGDEKTELKKFEVSYVVKYNAITLQEAADLEVKIRELFGDACKIGIIVKDVSYNLSSYGLIIGNSSILTTTIDTGIQYGGSIILSD